MKCVWSLRQCLLVIDFEDNSSASLKQVLHQCMIHPMYLKLEEVSSSKTMIKFYLMLLIYIQLLAIVNVGC